MLVTASLKYMGSSLRSPMDLVTPYVTTQLSHNLTLQVTMFTVILRYRFLNKNGLCNSESLELIKKIHGPMYLLGIGPCFFVCASESSKPGWVSSSETGPAHQ